MEWILNQFVGGIVNWKTTIISIATAIFVFLNGAGIVEISETERDTIISALIIIFGWFAKDSDKTGKPTE